VAARRKHLPAVVCLSQRLTDGGDVDDNNAFQPAALIWPNLTSKAYDRPLARIAQISIFCASRDKNARSTDKIA
jgi:hypothetical protein